MDALRARAAAGESLDALLPECFAIVRETGKRKMGMRHFDVQLIGGMVLHDGCIAEMKTGEGKTLTATLAVVLNSLAVREPGQTHKQRQPRSGLRRVPRPRRPGLRARPRGRRRGAGRRRGPAGAPALNGSSANGNDSTSAGAGGGGGGNGSLTRRGVHVVTVNDYLARRDAEWMKPIYDALGVSVGVLQNMQPYDEKQAAYACDVIYGTNSELGFDYLRDNMAKDLSEKVQRGHCVRGRGRGRQHPDRRGAYAADHLRGARTGGRPVREVRAPGAADEHGQDPEGMDPRTKKGFMADFDFEIDEKHKTRLDHRAGRRKGREIPRHRPPVPRRERASGQPPDPVAAGRGAVQARRRLRGDRRRGEDHRRVHRPDPRRAGAGRRGCTRRSRRRRACASRRRTRRSRRSPTRTTSGCTTSSRA